MPVPSASAAWAGIFLSPNPLCHVKTCFFHRRRFVFGRGGSFGGIGTNPTGLTYYRNPVHNTANDINDTLIVVSRGERKVSWVNVNTGGVIRALQDQKLVDPITADDNEGGGTNAPVISIADYTGKAVSNYRYGTLNLHPGFAACQQASGGCPTVNSSGGAAPFEFGGSLALPGKAFAIAGGNVP